MMAAHGSDEYQEPPAPPSVQWAAGIPSHAMPTDPLALAKAARKRGW
jgi:hypothetical protein